MVIEPSEVIPGDEHGGAAPKAAPHEGIQLLHQVVLADRHVARRTRRIFRTGNNPADRGEPAGLDIPDKYYSDR